MPPCRLLAVCLVVLAVTSGCGGDAPTYALGPSVRLVGDSTVGVASSITLNAQATDSVGNMLSGGLFWRSSDPSVASVSNAGVVTGLAAGVATITATSPFASATRLVTVRDERPTVPLAAGGSVTGRIVSGIPTERIALTVTAGDTLDLLVRLDSVDATLFAVHLRSVGADWLKPSIRTSEGIAIYGAVVPGFSGTYTLEALGDMVCGGRYCTPPSGSYVVRVRQSAPIFSVPRYYERGVQTLAEGTTGRDTVWAQNIGRGTVMVRVGSSVPWLRPDAPTVALAGPKVGGDTRDVTTPIAVTVDARGLAQGEYESAIDLDGSTGEWGPFRPFGRYVRRVRMLVTDSSARLLTAKTSLFSPMTTGPDGRVYSVRADSVITVDPVTGATAPVTRLPFRPSEVAVAGDGTLYVRSVLDEPTGVFRVVGGAVEPVIEAKDCSGSLVVTPNATTYVYCGTTLYRRAAGGAPEVVRTFAFSTSPVTMVYRPADDAIYLVHAGTLWRYDQAAKQLAARGEIPRTDVNSFFLRAVDAQGRLYAGLPFAHEVRVLDTTGAVIDRRFLPVEVNALTITGSTIVTSGGQLYRLPVR